MPNWVGDAVMSLPTVRSVKEYFPDCMVAISAPKNIASLFDKRDLVSLIIETPCGNFRKKLRAEIEFHKKVKEENFELAIVLPNSFESAARVWCARIPKRIGYRGDVRSLLLTQSVPKTKKILREHTIKFYLNLLNYLNVPPACEIPSISLTDDSLNFAVEFLDKNCQKGGRGFFALGTGASFGTAKIWSEEFFVETANFLIEEYDAEIVLLGSQEEIEDVSRLGSQIARKPMIAATSLINSAAILSLCQGFVGNDSGLMHLAAATGIPTIGLFFSTNPERNYPVGRNAYYITKKIHCAYCEERLCPLGTHECATAITPREVMAKFEEILRI